ncbi:fatty-acyl coenzyme A oxidase [Savitreella phatthalungensis]
MSKGRSRVSSITHHLNPVTVDPALDTVLAMETEREATNFDVRELTYFLDGGRKQTQLKERLMLSIERDPDMRNDDWYDLTKDQVRERTMKKFRNMAHYVTSDPEQVTFLRLSLISIVDPGFWTRFGVHYGLFFNALRGQANSAQLGYWISRGAASLQGIVGCFCMTELGHGSNVQALETTATFDQDTDEFVIHTPSLTATKWWIGGAAHSATHSVVFAQLIVHGKRHGVKTFVVPLRNANDYSLKPGVTIGDLGKKMGRDGIDNGYVQFSHVRIPRMYMLMKHTQVSREGIVKEPALAQLTYGALITGRTAMVLDSSAVSKRITTIAIRYACVRRQFASSPDKPETKLIDYAMHQRRLMPLLAQTYAMQFAGDKLYKMYNECMKKLEDAEGADKKATEDAVETLKELHATSAGLKAFCTWSALESIDKCRQACGGHGYSAYNGFGSAFADFAVHCTWEGDNTILSLQAGRALIGSYKDAVAGKQLPSGTAYLNKREQLKSARAQGRDISDHSVIKEAWDCCSAVAVEKAALAFEGFTSKGKSTDEAYELTSQLRALAAQIHTRGFLVKGFLETLEGAPAEIAKVIRPLAHLYAMWSIEENSGVFLQAGYFTSENIDAIRTRTTELCLEVRGQCIGLTDAFNLSDFFINAPIGTADGDIYPKYFAQINKSSPPGRDHPYFESIIKPLITRSIEDPEEIEEEEEDE